MRSLSYSFELETLSPLMSTIHLTSLGQNVHTLPRILETKITFTIASRINIPLCIDSESNKPAFDKAFDHYVRMLVDIDLKKELKTTNSLLKRKVTFFVWR